MTDLHDKNGKPLAVGDAVMMTNPIGKIPASAALAGVISGVVCRQPCRACGETFWVWLQSDASIRYCGCALTKIDGSGVEEEQEEVECV